MMRRADKSLSSRLNQDWEPTLLEEEVLAEGTWWYDGKVPYSISLKRQKFDYTAADVEAFGQRMHEINMDYPDYSINSEGEIYVWFFVGPTGESRSSSLSSLEAAKRHVQTYGKVEIDWR